MHDVIKQTIANEMGGDHELFTFYVNYGTVEHYLLLKSINSIN